VRPQLDLVEVAGVGNDGIVGCFIAAQHGVPGFALNLPPFE
jgi:hypothetical protein